MFMCVRETQKRRSDFVYEGFECTYMKQGQPLLRSQVAELITEDKLDG